MFYIFKEHPHSADKKIKKLEDRKGRNNLENLLEIYEQTYVKEMEKIVQAEKKATPSPVDVVQTKERKNKSFHDFSRKKPQTTDIIKETSEEITEEFSFKDLKEQNNTAKSSEF